MKESIYKNYDELPLFLNAATVAKALGIAPSSSYELMHEKDFPALRIGNRFATDERKAGERTGVVNAPVHPTNARSAGIFKGL